MNGDLIKEKVAIILRLYWVIFTTWMKRHSFTNSYLIDL